MYWDTMDLFACVYLFLFGGILRNVLHVYICLCVEKYFEPSGMLSLLYVYVFNSLVVQHVRARASIREKE